MDRAKKDAGDLVSTIDDAPLHVSAQDIKYVPMSRAPTASHGIWLQAVSAQDINYVPLHAILDGGGGGGKKRRGRGGREERKKNRSTKEAGETGQDGVRQGGQQRQGKKEGGRCTRTRRRHARQRKCWR